ncbi:unnamed protein product [Coregonus sp. 'balchen']|nr:unnamed protein product [Coregonus sp. 'balchen']
MTLNNKEPFSDDYEGQHFLVKYQDAEGKVNQPHMNQRASNVLWLKKQRQYFLINLVVFIAKVNKHFGRAY